MPAAKILEAMNQRLGLDRTGHNAFERGSDLCGKCLDHRVSGLAERDDEHAGMSVQIVEIVADTQDAALAMHVPRKALRDRGFRQRLLEDVARDLPDDTHAFTRSRTHSSMASRNSRRRPSKK